MFFDAFFFSILKVFHAVVLWGPAPNFPCPMKKKRSAYPHGSPGQDASIPNLINSPSLGPQRPFLETPKGADPGGRKRADPFGLGFDARLGVVD